ncbi:PmoA family protein [Actinoplanes sp. CA-142083]|uniref:DUF6807 domain-containing protein n=1 Tax=Actinoplanes sp. CA-142083 TaxID=3239903 RepID=UPI003D905BEF
MTADEAASVPLLHQGRAVADYRWRPRLAHDLAPRPYLHPVRTLAGTEVTEHLPADHPHHLGAGVAVPDISGANFWGGRTFVANRGPVMLANHGTQQHHNWLHRAPGEVVHELRWCGPDGAELLRERRRIAVLPAGPGWAVDLSFELTNRTALPITFASPATKGRPGAGYGGFFWRAPRTPQGVRAYGPGPGGEKGLHGRRTAWLALTGTGTNGRRWTLVFVQAGPDGLDDPWFVRTRDYPGIGSALAWDRPLLLASGDAVSRRFLIVVADGILPARGAAEAAFAALRHVGGPY